MNNAFLRHGIDHLSPSSLNTWANEPALWTLERLLKKAAPKSAAVHRGTAIEAGVTVGLLYPDKPVPECQQIALQQYDSLVAPDDPNREREREAVAPTVVTALAELRAYGVPDEVQFEIKRTLDDVPVPLIGYIDFGWVEHGITLDLKTSLRLASDIATAHARQVALYVIGTNREGRVAYATPRKIGVYRLEQVEQRVAELRQIALRLERFLSLSADPWQLAGLLTPHTDSFYWTNPVAKAARVEVYGM